MPRRLARWGPLLVVVVAFEAVLLRGRVLYERDVHLYWVPHMLAVVRAVGAGEWPFWNPSSGFGEPMWANPSLQLLYPPTWALLLLSPWRYWSLTAAAHMAMSVAGLMLLGRRLGLSRPAAGLAASLWAGSGPLLSMVSLPHHYCGATLLPWILWASDRALGAPSRRRVAALSALVGLQLLAGSADMVAMGLLASATLGLRWLSPATAGRWIATLAAAAAIGVGVAAVLWFPTLAQALSSERSGLEWSTRTFWSLHPLAALELILPLGLRELPFHPAVQTELFEGREPFLYSIYIGLPTVVLAAIGLVRCRRIDLLLALVAGGALAAALGRHTPVYALLTALVPPLQMLRYPVKALVVVAVAVALLAGAGLDGWQHLRPLAARRRAFLLAAAGLLAVAAGAAITALAPEWGSALVMRRLGWRTTAEIFAPVVAGISRAGLLAAAGGVAWLAATGLREPWRTRLVLAGSLAVVAEPLAAHRGLNPTAPATFYTWRPPVVDALRPPDHGRAWVYEYEVVAGRSQHYLGRPTAYVTPLSLSPERVPWAEALALRSYPIPPVALGWAIPGSFDVDPLGFYPAALAEFVWSLRDVEGTPAHTRLLRVGAVARVASLHERGFTHLEPVAVLPGLLPEPVRVFGVAGALPRAAVVGGVTPVRSGSALAALLDPGHDPHRSVVLENAAARVIEPDGFRGDARIRRVGADRVVVDTFASAPGHLVLADAFWPGWTARVDGHRASVLRANAALRAVAVPAGRHHVEMRYRPPGLVAGLLASAAGLVLLALLAGWPRAPAPASQLSRPGGP